MKLTLIIRNIVFNLKNLTFFGSALLHLAVVEMFFEIYNLVIHHNNSLFPIIASDWFHQNVICSKQTLSIHRAGTKIMRHSLPNLPFEQTRLFPKAFAIAP
jgi:hypothetical protein